MSSPSSTPQTPAAPVSGTVPPDPAASVPLQVVSLQNTEQIAKSGAMRRRFFVVFFSGLVVLAICWAGWWYWVWRVQESTDDAYVAGNVVRIMPQVSGKVLEVLADDTDRVLAGQMLVRLDPHDAQLALDRAVVELAVVVRDICRLQAQWRESLAQVHMVRVSLEQARVNLQRREALGRENAVRVEELHDYRAQEKKLAAQLTATLQQQQALEAQLLQNSLAQQPRVQQAAAYARQCWLAVQRTAVPSPVTGQVVQRNVQAGAVVAAGTSLMAVVPLDAVWIDANFKEVQLRHMRIGQSAEVRVDMHGEAVTYQGRVAGFAAGTGSAFALIPPQNATGNWIKIVQRVPVRIEIQTQSMKEYPLLVGLSATVTVNVADSSGSLLCDAPRQRPLPSMLTAQGVEPDMAPIEALIVQIIADNTLSAE